MVDPVRADHLAAVRDVVGVEDFHNAVEILFQSGLSYSSTTPVRAASASSAAA